MKKLFTLAIVAIAAFMFATVTMAQTSTTGTIEGVVADQNGAVVPNATVSLSGPNLIRAQTTNTDSNGMYRFLQVPPGRYTVSVAAISGFAAFTRENVEVNLSRSTTLNVTMTTGVAGQVDVIATPDIDTVSNTTGSNVSTEQFSNFPTGRTVQSLYSIAPTVARSGLRDASGRDRDPSVGGSSGPENNYILDGVTTTDPAFGGSGANLPFEFVQEVEIKTGAYGAEYGKSTGGIFNVITKSGSNSFHGDLFAYFTAKSFVSEVKPSAIPSTGTAPDGFSELDAGVDIGGPIVKDKLWFFAAFNPQRRTNSSLTQTFLVPVENKVSTPFYAGKLTWGINDNHTFTFSTFGDFTKQEGFLFGSSGFGSDPNSFRGEIQTGGSNYAFRLNSAFTPTFTAEFSAGLHFQRANTLPEASVADIEQITDNFAILGNSGILTPTATNVTASNGLFLAFVNGTGAGTSVQRNFVRQGFGLGSTQDRDRAEFAARLQNIWGKHTVKYGFEFGRNKYRIGTFSTGPTRDFGAPVSGPLEGFRVTNNFGICQGDPGASQIVCPNATFTTRVNQLIAAGSFAGQYTSAVNGPVSLATIVNPILILSTVSARDFQLTTRGTFTHTDTESFYVQDDWKITRDFTVNLGLRWDYQQSAGSVTDYFSLNNFKDNMQPRLGFIWDFTGKGRGKLFANYARFVETPIPLDLNVRAGGDDQQIDRNLRVSRLNAVQGSTTISDFGSLGSEETPIDPGLKPQTVNEFTGGFEWGPDSIRDLSFGIRGIYRAQDDVIEDGSFDDGHTYFIFNPGRRGPGTTEESACTGTNGAPVARCFGPARRYYRAVEFTATKRFSNNYQFIASYVFSSLIGNYEGLFRNDNGQSDPNITSLFDLVSLLDNTYGRLPNDRPHQFKFNGSYRWPFKLLTSASFTAQSGIPFDKLIPHELYGNNEGFAVQRGTAINPITGSNRTPTTYQLDLGAYYPIAFDESKELRFTFDAFNVFNSQKAIRQDTTFSINSGSAGIAPIENPFFGRGTIFQFPRALRLGVKFSF